MREGSIHFSFFCCPLLQATMTTIPKRHPTKTQPLVSFKPPKPTDLLKNIITLNTEDKKETERNRFPTCHVMVSMVMSNQRATSHGKEILVHGRLDFFCPCPQATMKKIPKRHPTKTQPSMSLKPPKPTDVRKNISTLNTEVNLQRYAFEFWRSWASR